MRDHTTGDVTANGETTSSKPRTEVDILKEVLSRPLQRPPQEPPRLEPIAPPYSLGWDNPEMQ